MVVKSVWMIITSLSSYDLVNSVTDVGKVRLLTGQLCLCDQIPYLAIMWLRLDHRARGFDLGSVTQKGNRVDP